MWPKRFVPNFRRLQWKLTFTYTLVTTAAILVVEVILLAAAWFLFSQSETFLKVLVPVLQDATVSLAPALEQTPPDTSTLDQWLENLGRSGVVEYGEKGRTTQIRLNLDPAVLTLAAITDVQGRVISVYPPAACSLSVPLVDCVGPDAGIPLRNALSGEENPSRLVARVEGDMIVVAPVHARDGHLVGALFLRMTLPRTLTQVPVLLARTLLSSALVIVLFAAVIGTVFGFLTARSLTHRLDKLMSAADAWSRGDFTVLVRDSSQDELGHLARRLNRMAEELQNLLQTREELAALEERNRLARDLHDSVKQQVFATAMQIAAARHLLDQNPEQAKIHLEEAEHLARQAQQELTALIRELRPAALAGKGLVAALREYVDEWARQTGIRATVRVRGERALPLRVEQAIFRIAQEALANVAKHSGATTVDIHLAWDTEEFVMTIEDNGRGFDVNATRDKGVGLRSIEERAKDLKGEAIIESAPGQGTCIRVRCPLIQ